MRKRFSSVSDEIISQGNDGLLFGIEPYKPKTRIYYLDVLRVVACIAVVLIHVSASYVKSDIGSFNFWIGNIFDSLARIAVPLFVMISGALLLDEKYNYSKKKLVGHMRKLIIFFFFWSAMYAMVFNIIVQIANHEPINILNIISTFFGGYYHLWFIYMIIGLYLILPLLRLWVKKENKKYVKYFIILALIFTFILPWIADIGSSFSPFFGKINMILNEKLFLKYVGGYTTYFLLGWYINNFKINKRKIIYLLGIVCTLLTIVGTFILSMNTGAAALQMYNDLGINVLLQSVAVFLFVKMKWNNSEAGESKIVRFISNNSLGIYALHVLVIRAVYVIFNVNGFDIAILSIPFVSVMTFAISLFISYIFSKIPFLKRVV